MNNVISRAMKASLLLSVLASSITQSDANSMNTPLKRANRLKSDPSELQFLENATQNKANPFLLRKALLAFGVGMGIGAGLESTQFFFGKKRGLITLAENQVGKAGMGGAIALGQGVNLLLEVGREQRQKIEGDETPLNSRDQMLVNTAGFAGSFLGKFLVNSLYDKYVGQGNNSNSSAAANAAAQQLVD